MPPLSSTNSLTVCLFNPFGKMHFLLSVSTSQSVIHKKVQVLNGRIDYDYSACTEEVKSSARSQKRIG